jgi:hypothetical protein
MVPNFVRARFERMSVRRGSDRGHGHLLAGAPLEAAIVGRLDDEPRKSSFRSAASFVSLHDHGWPWPRITRPSTNIGCVLQEAAVHSRKIACC